MSAWDGWRHRLRVWLRPGSYDREMAEEQAFHLSLAAMQQEHAARGAMSLDEARAAARRRYGNLTRTREEARQMAGLTTLEMARQDVRFALRSFRRAPAFTAVAALTLAIGIGANTAIFSALDALLLRPLPFTEPDRLMKLSLTRPARGDHPANDDAVWSWPKFMVFRESQRLFAAAGQYQGAEVTVRSGDGAERVKAEFTEGAYFTALGVRPALGRNFVSQEDSVPGGPKSVILSDLLFTRRFGADPSIIGKPLRIGADQFVVIGVMPRGFRGLTGKAELWVPILATDPTAPQYAWSHGYSVVARRRPDVSVEQARVGMAALGRVIDARYPDPAAIGGNDGAIARPLDATRVDPTVRRSLYIVFGAVGLVLLIACANVANLFLVRATSRSHEIAVRMAMGATRARLVRQLLTESVILAFTGGALGVFLAWASVRALASIDPAQAFRARSLEGIGAVGFDGIRMDPMALAVAAALSLLTGLLFGVIPAIQSTRSDVSDGLRNGRMRGRGNGLFGFHTRDVLVGVEIMLAVVLLAGSGLMVRSLAKLLAIDPGFETERILTLRLSPREGTPRDSAPAFYDRVSERLAALPTVTGVAVQDCPPLNGGCNGTSMVRNDRPPMAPGTEPSVGVHWITPSWPAVMNVPLRSGRLFDARDRAGARKAVLLSETAARRLWPNESPIGKPVGIGQGGFDSAYVVGVVGDVRYNTIDSLPGADSYLPLAQSPRGRMMLLIRAPDPGAIIPSVRAALREIAPDVPVYDIRTMTSRVSDSTAYARFATVLIVLFGVIALGLATLGVYGVISFVVSQRTREIGIRIALGAQTGGVVRMVVGQGLRVAVAGAAAGLVVAFASTRVLSSMLYDVAPSDPVTFVAILAVLLAAVGTASWIPARRAAGIQPTEALREES